MNERFEFHPHKSGINKDLHGIDFEEAQALWRRTHVILPARNSAGEERSFIVGQLDGKLYAAVLTRRRDTIRLITCHRADKRFKRAYDKATKNEA